MQCLKQFHNIYQCQFWWVQSTVWDQPTCVVKAHLWACFESLQIELSHLLRNDQDLWEVWLLLMRSDPKHVVHAGEKEKKEENAIWLVCVTKRNTRWRVEARESHSVIVRETQVRASGGAIWRDREKHSESVKEWKRKMRHFSLLKLHTRKINW